MGGRRDWGVAPVKSCGLRSFFFLQSVKTRPASLPSKPLATQLVPTSSHTGATDVFFEIRKESHKATCFGGGVYTCESKIYITPRRTGADVHTTQSRGCSNNVNVGREERQRVCFVSFLRVVFLGHGKRTHGKGSRHKMKREGKVAHKEFRGFGRQESRQEKKGWRLFPSPPGQPGRRAGQRRPPPNRHHGGGGQQVVGPRSHAARGGGGDGSGRVLAQEAGGCVGEKGGSVV